jgi:carbon storage regulator
MLLLSRKVGEKIVIKSPGGDIWVTVTEVDRGKVRLGIDCPREIAIWREELLGREKPPQGGGV